MMIIIIVVIVITFSANNPSLNRLLMFLFSFSSLSIDLPSLQYVQFHNAFQKEPSEIDDNQAQLYLASMIYGYYLIIVIISLTTRSSSSHYTGLWIK